MVDRETPQAANTEGSDYKTHLAFAAGFLSALAERIAGWRLADGSLENFDTASKCEALALKLRKVAGVSVNDRSEDRG